MYWLGDRRRKYAPVNRRNAIPACRECNSLLSNHCINTIRERAEYLTEAIEKKHKKLLEQPIWTEEELDKVGDGMRAFICAKAIQRQIIIDRLAHLGVISRFGSFTVEEHWDKVE